MVHDELMGKIKKKKAENDLLLESAVNIGRQKVAGNSPKLLYKAGGKLFTPYVMKIMNFK